MQVTVSGATGLIGSRLVKELVAAGHSVRALSRDPSKKKNSAQLQWLAWQPENEPPPRDALDGADAVINLIGERVDQRWTKDIRETIRTSRVLGTCNLIEGLRSVKTRPAVLLNASAIGIYGDRGSEVLDEDSSLGSDFLAQVCKEWEQTALVAQSLGIRVVLLRTGIVLSADGGALKRMLLPFKLGLGAKLGNGSQYTAWIHIDDQLSLIRSALENPSFSGPLNLTAPSPCTNAELSKALGKTLHRPVLLKVPMAVLKLALGDASEAITASQRVLPKKAEQLGFQFQWPHLDDALADLVG